MKPETRKIREMNHWRRIKRNGNLLKKKKEIIEAINRESNKRKLCSVHDYSKADYQSVIETTLDDSGIHSTPEQSIAINNISENPTESNIVTTVDNDQFIYSASSELHSAIHSANNTTSYSESEIDIVDVEQIKFRQSLMNWAIKYQVKHNALNELLSIMKNEFPFIDLPTDARTLVKTPRTTTISVINGKDGHSGHYWHYGLKKVLAEAITCVSHIGTTFKLNINIDGLPMFRSSSNSFWPILVDIHELKTDIPPLIVAIYCGKGR